VSSLRRYPRKPPRVRKTRRASTPAPLHRDAADYASLRRERAAATRDSLVTTAMRIFNEVGYWGTDSNALARAAGYSPGTFYRHFPDKRAIFLAAYQEWASAEHAVLLTRLERAKASSGDIAGAFVEHMIEYHRRWCMFRACLRVLSASDPEISKAVRAHRRRYLDLLADILGSGDLVDRLVVLYSLDGAADAVAAGEPRNFGLNSRDVSAGVRGLFSGARSR